MIEKSGKVVLKRSHERERNIRTHSSILAWRIPWTEARNSPWDLKELDMAELLSTLACTTVFGTVLTSP